MKSLKNQDIYDDFVGLFFTRCNEVYVSQYVGIFEKTNQPALILEEMLANYCTRYFLIKELTYEDVRNLAKRADAVTSKCAHHFLKIDEHNWLDLFRNALKSVDEKYLNLARKQWYHFLIGQDIRYYMDKKK